MHVSTWETMVKQVLQAIKEIVLDVIICHVKAFCSSVSIRKCVENAKNLACYLNIIYIHI